MPAHSHANHAAHADHAGHAGHHVAHHAGTTRQTYVPTNKTIGATVGSAVSGLIVFALNQYKPGLVTADVASMINVVAAFAVGYVVPPGEREVSIVTPRGRRSASI